MDDETSLNGQLMYDRVRRKLGFLRPEEGLMDSVDRLELAKKRGLILNAESVTLDSVRKSIGLPCKGEVL